MTARDRLVLSFLVVAVILAGVWIEIVSPERKQAARADSQVESARSALQNARNDTVRAEQDKARYAKAYSDIVRLGKAVPSNPEVPALIYQIEKASGRSVDFNSISPGDGGSTPTMAPAPVTPEAAGGEGASPASPSGSTPGSEALSSAFTSLPFTFVFEGTFDSLSNLLDQIDAGVRTNASGGMRVDGRLLTIQSVALTAAQAPGTGGTPRLTGTVTASAYTLPGIQGLTDGATSAAPPTGAQSLPEGSSGTIPGSATPAVITAQP